MLAGLSPSIFASELRWPQEGRLADFLALAQAEVRLPESLRQAAAKRQRDWWFGRYCARQAMRALGTEPGELPSGADRAPVWPAGIIGSLTHTEGYAAAAVARRAQYRGIGIDAEKVMVETVAAEVAGTIVTPAEWPLGEGWEHPRFVSLVFSAKESFYKCIAPVARQFFGYEAAALTEITPGGFRIELLTALSPELPAGFALRGRYVFDRGLVQTAIVWESAC